MIKNYDLRRYSLNGETYYNNGSSPISYGYTKAETDALILEAKNNSYTYTSSSVVIAKNETYTYVMESSMTVVSIVYDELKTLKDNNKLSPGRYYRITDYVTTTSASSTISEQFQFDVLVQALDNHTFSNNALATWHTFEEGENDYFKNSRLDCWQLKYSFANDINLFEWADTTEGKGVIYYMKDEYGNEAPYDFKNILYTVSGRDRYTFAALNGASIKDTTMNGSSHNNKIGELINNGQHKLNWILFNGLDMVYNTFGDGCHEITIGGSIENDIIIYPDGNGHCHGNNFGIMNSLDTFGKFIQHNTFGNNCYNFKLGDTFRYANVGNDSHHITFVNTAGDLLSDIHNVSIGEAVHWVTFKTNASGNLLQNLNIAMGLSGTALYNPLVVELACPRDAKYTWNVAYDNTGNVRQWCDADTALNTVTITPQDNVYTIIPNKMCSLGTVTGTVSIVLDSGFSTVTNIYAFTFTADTTAPTITWPAGISWAGGVAPTLIANKTYEVSILNNLAVIVAF